MFLLRDCFASADNVGRGGDKDVASIWQHEKTASTEEGQQQ